MSHLKFAHRPMDNNKEIMSHEVIFGEIPAIMELWSWEGITGSSVIFHNEDVWYMNEQKLVRFVFEHLPSVKDQTYTYKRSGNFIFINFGFKED